MIIGHFIEKQLEKSFAQRRTSPFLRRLLFSPLDQAARQHYGDHYPMKCVQCAAVTTTILRSWGIKCGAHVGAMCIAEAFDDPHDFQWGGF